MLASAETKAGGGGEVDDGSERMERRRSKKGEGRGRRGRVIQEIAPLVWHCWKLEGEEKGEGGDWVRTVYQTVGEGVDAVHHDKTWNQNFISHQSLLYSSLNKPAYYASSITSHSYSSCAIAPSPVHVRIAPGRRLLHKARETYQQRKRVPLAPLCMSLAT